MTTIAEIVRGLYGDRTPSAITKTIITGQSRGVWALPSRHRPPIYADPPAGLWEARVRRWHAEQRERDPRQWHPFLRAVESRKAERCT